MVTIMQFHFMFHIIQYYTYIPIIFITVSILILLDGKITTVFLVKQVNIFHDSMIYPNIMEHIKRE